MSTQTSASAGVKKPVLLRRGDRVPHTGFYGWREVFWLRTARIDPEDGLVPYLREHRPRQGDRH